MNTMMFNDGAMVQSNMHDMKLEMGMGMQMPMTTTGEGSMGGQM